MTAPSPDNESARLEWLRESRVLDSPREATFDDITQLAATLCAAPIASISLLDDQRVWFKSCVGVDLCETGRDDSFCAHTVLQNDIFIVPDATLDDRFAANPYVTGDPNIRFYAGAPLTTSDGLTLGSLAVMDRVPRQLSAEQMAALAVLARQIVDRLQLQRRIALQDVLIAERAEAQEALRRSEAELNAVVENSTDGVYLIDPSSGRLLRTNSALRALLGYTEEEARGLDIYDIVAHTRRSIDRRMTELRTKLHLPMAERQYLRKDRSVVVMESTARVVHYAGGMAICVVAHDVTEKRVAESARQAAEANYQALFENAAEGIFQTTPEGFYLRANPALARIYGYASSEQMIRELTDVARQLYVDPGRRDEFQRLMREHGRVTRFEAQVYRRDGTVIWISESARAVHTEGGLLRWYEGFVEDITDRKQLEADRERALRAAEDRADRDPLTGLWNHRAFQHRFAREAERARQHGTPLGVVMLDLDNFQFFNDAYGHILGDSVLKQVADRLQAACGRNDVVARFGGDEFAVLLPEIGGASTAEIESWLHAELDSMVYIAENEPTPIPVTVSLGVAIYTDEDADRFQALRLAEERLRWAKLGGDIDSEADRVRLAMNGVEGFTMLDALVTAVDNKDRYTRRHSEDVMSYSLLIARELGLDEVTRQTVAVASLLHDVGKIGVPNSVLRKPGRLTEEEFEVIKQHPQMGAAIVGAVPGLAHTLEAVRHHHERWDGNGYPSRIKGAATPIIARLMSVADAFSAMTTDRPYRKGMARERAIAILREGAGAQWDPDCVNALLRALDRNSALQASL